METAGLIDEATAALSRLNAEALRRLEARALVLRPLRMEDGEGAEVRARFRVFASVLRETDRGLRILRRVRGGGDRWER